MLYAAHSRQTARTANRVTASRPREVLPRGGSAWPTSPTEGPGPSLLVPRESRPPCCEVARAAPWRGADLPARRARPLGRTP